MKVNFTGIFHIKLFIRDIIIVLILNNKNWGNLICLVKLDEYPNLIMFSKTKNITNEKNIYFSINHVNYLNNLHHTKLILSVLI